MYESVLYVSLMAKSDVICLFSYLTLHQMDSQFSFKNPAIEFKDGDATW